MDSRSQSPGTDKTDQLVWLLREIAGGDRGAFKLLYQRTSAKLYGICLRLTGNEAEAQEVLQEVFLTVWRKADRFDAGKAGAITWLSVLARNRAIDRIRQRRSEVDDADAAAKIPDEAPSAFDVVGQAQDSVRLSECLNELEERARTAIRSAFFEGSTYPQLAAQAGVPLPTMKSWIRRGLQRLRGCLER
ncbi:sigma-70 family RNA polymerase sigma factor [Sphingomonas agri]|uniref:sigma-70 family RNA polymerase sigma factor n=1 Tax=Sphingomonas agri TaxID=1813878 RepID=UPI0031201AF3